MDLKNKIESTAKVFAPGVVHMRAALLGSGVGSVLTDPTLPAASIRPHPRPQDRTSEQEN